MNTPHAELVEPLEEVQSNRDRRHDWGGFRIVRLIGGGGGIDG